MFRKLLLALLFAFVSAQAAGESQGNSTSCTSGYGNDYDLNFHIGGVFIVFAISGLGMFSSMYIDGFKLPIIGNVLQLLKMFGIGIIVSTAWIHLLPDAFSQFSNPCLSVGWQSYGTNYVGLFGVAASFMVQLLELASSQHTHQHEYEYKDNETATVVQPAGETVFVLVDGTSAVKEKVEHAPKKFQTVILESGILVHSLIIGLTLGVTPDSGFSTLLAAICFHQMFEGMALGVLVSNAEFDIRGKVLLGIMYPLTTPIGIAVGIAIRNQFNENNDSVILAQGILDSISAGILFYNSYAELISNEINHSPSFKRYAKGFKTMCFFSMYLGAAAMAVVGIWA
ncbi:high-affinity Zn(2+) transporter zrt1 [Boothiomyces macroporosus]|uniref:High-affinity Zn(2+) transporter zrt1 n=1 Tax=Boothiomyces macroporosus TaxID=261099 RepID=A0AAD5UHL1_9FUNG|nr:high-affinity Zn(2+) transporter zrt1 [Boothiomyces macroporosus]